MQTYWLHKNNSSELILFFAGFASHPSHYKHLDSKIDVLMCYDYQIFYLDIDMAKYEKIWLVAYSMGVSVAARLLKDMQNTDIFTRKIALSGTNYGIHETLGIPQAIFMRTIKKFNLKDFKSRIFGENIGLTKGFCFANETHLQAELQYLYDFCNAENVDFTWDRIYISTKDTIFPPQMCYLSFGNDREAICKLPTWHYPFFMFKTWESICNID